jgi:hypothetical protein
VEIFLGNGAGGFTGARTSVLTGGTAPRSIAVGDFNGDGKLGCASVAGGFSS